MEIKLFKVLDQIPEDYSINQLPPDFLCYLIIETDLKYYEVRNLVVKAYNEAYKYHEKDFTDEFEKRIRKIEEFKNPIIIYDEIIYIY